MKNATKTTTRFKLVSSKDFLKDFKHPEYLIDGFLQRGYLNAITGHPGQGKTAIALCLAMHVINGWTLNGREVKKGKVLFFAGENPDDIRMRWFLLAAEYGFDANHKDMIWCKESGDFTADLEAIFQQANDLSDVVLVVIDTSSAYFPGEDENNNSQSRAHWASMREFTQSVANRPCVLVLCHPSKSATDLVPRGGSAALGEMDCNLTCELENDIATIEPHYRKFRGVRFNPLSFKMIVETCPAIQPKDGRKLFAVYAEPMKDTDVENAHTLRKRQNQRVEELHLQGVPVRKIVEHLKSEFKDDALKQTTVFRYTKSLEQQRNGAYGKH